MRRGTQGLRSVASDADLLRIVRDIEATPAGKRTEQEQAMLRECGDELDRRAAILQRDCLRKGWTEMSESKTKTLRRLKLMELTVIRAIDGSIESPLYTNRDCDEDERRRAMIHILAAACAVAEQWDMKDVADNIKRLPSF